MGPGLEMFILALWRGGPNNGEVDVLCAKHFSHCKRKAPVAGSFSLFINNSRGCFDWEAIMLLVHQRLTGAAKYKEKHVAV